MLTRIQKAVHDGAPLTRGQQNFMTHELTEKGLMDAGMPYKAAQDIAPDTHPFGQNYDPDVLQNGWFGEEDQNAWVDN